MHERPLFLGQVRLAQVVVPTPPNQIPPGTSPVVPPVKVDLVDVVFGAGILAAIGTAAYAIFS